MYYKIENKECEVYKQLHKMRTEELALEEENKNKIIEKIGRKWSKFIGYTGQQNLNRCTTYIAFKFNNAENVDLKTWRKYETDSDYFTPNLRTKKGREIQNFLDNLEKSSFTKPLKILGLEAHGRFTFPFVEICKNGVIVLYLGNNHIPQDENVIEITSKEFEELRTQE